MDREREQENLRRAEDDIAAAWRRIEEQRDRVGRLAADGHGTAAGEALLGTMLESARAMEEHRELILRQLAS